MILSQISSIHSPKVRPIRQQKPLATNKPLIKTIYTLFSIYARFNISKGLTTNTSSSLGQMYVSTSAKIATKIANQNCRERTNERALIEIDCVSAANFELTHYRAPTEKNYIKRDGENTCYTRSAPLMLLLLLFLLPIIIYLIF